ncbi:MAG: GSCFA domain-containing protein [Chitinophagales bacterium]
MEFRKVIPISKSSFFIHHRDEIILMGSCFTENIGEKLRYYGFNITKNPFGIIYNPVSIFQNLDSIIQRKKYTTSDLMKRNDLYISLDHHGSYSDTDQERLLHTINSEVEHAYNRFTSSNYIMFTLGTSFIYRHTASGNIAANCHKLPNTQFEKKLLTTDEIKSAFRHIKPHLAGKTIIFTVSPVRHWRDGAVQNQRSKSILIESIHQIIEENDNCFYFPAYEIMMDELRDYRFYDEDMLHPNQTAVNYIWERFCQTYFDAPTQEIIEKIHKLRLMVQHRIKHSNTAEQAAFEQQKDLQIAAFQIDFPAIRIDFTPSGE